MYELAHTCIVVKDIYKSKEFYMKVLNLALHSELETDRLKMVLLDTGSSKVELIQYKNMDYTYRERGPIDHIAFYVDDLDKEIVSIKSRANIEFLTEPKMLNGKKLVFFKGLSGERIEIIEK
ncbi:VOC family protein [Clostridiaceae bacterium M8S5]|nr:VOC family protein [Clostridiaceae bacterium M8S5]